MQIKQLVLYGYNGKLRTLKFNLGKVNIITGKNRSGKSAISDIIDYCLGGDTCNIADGIIRETIAWYGLLLQFDKEQIFVARKNPDKGHHSSSACYIEIGKELDIPKPNSFHPNQNVAGLEETLSKRLGISDNLHTPPATQTRNPLSANIRHSLYYCFQNQDEIAAKNFLFHNQSDDFITLAIKDTLPYFLGIVNENTLALENKRSILKRQLAVQNRRKEEHSSLIGIKSERGISLVSEAIQVGLLPESISIDNMHYNDIFDLLYSISNWSPDTPVYVGTDRLSYLQEHLNKTYEELEQLQENLHNAKIFFGDTQEYNNEIEQQKLRLESIGLFEQLSFAPDECPFCSNKLPNPLPSIKALQSSILSLDKSIKSITRERPKLGDYINKLEQTKQETKEKICAIQREIDGIYAQYEESQKIKDLNARRSIVIGRISLWLESIHNTDLLSTYEFQIDNIKQQIEDIDIYLDQDYLDERKTSILSRLQIDMTKWAQELKLEHCNNPYRLDLNKITVIVDKPERPVPLKQLGSGSNWVGIHLITYFALHKFFINSNRPVPRFLFLDQPSQVYFPSESTHKTKDWTRIHEMYNFIIERVKEFNGKLQVIIVDHANLEQDNFQSLVIENWHNEDSLIPQDWYTQ